MYMNHFDSQWMGISLMQKSFKYPFKSKAVGKHTVKFNSKSMIGIHRLS